MYALVSTIEDCKFVRVFKSEQNAIDWAYEWIKGIYGEDAACCTVDYLSGNFESKMSACLYIMKCIIEYET